VTFRSTLTLLGALMAASCSDTPAEPTDTREVPLLPAPAPVSTALLAGDFPELSSKDCEDVARFYFDAIGARAFDKAELVWNDPLVDAARLRSVYAGYGEPQFEWSDPFVEGAAGSLYCAVGGTVADAAYPRREVVQGNLTLRRANDVPGATPAQLRWTIQSSTFVETLERSGEP